uniref:SEC7 domain-containing protein n=1 Tax=Rhodosorus marinus TaxID=101924 RepID=A0A7S3A2K3_9RHOD|mmetsp:Transcript_42539/g.166050  ORF Transcript_42539/g.166050 Transcript_42539/m.166050 type:complete len:1599 (+) Transcript_42539:270-5066(+)
MADGETEHEVVLGVARGEGSGPGAKDDKYIRSGSMEIELDGPDTESVFENIPQVDYQTFTEPDSESKEASEEYQQVDLKPQDVSASVHMVESKESSSSQARTELMEVKRTPSQGQVKTDFKGLNYPIDERVPVSDETPQLGDLEPGVQEISTVASERKEEKRSEVEGTGAGGVATAGNTPMELGRMHLEPGDSRAGSGIEIQASKNGENDSVDMGPERDHADPDMRTVDLESSGPGPNRESTDLRLHSTMADSSNLDTSGNPGDLESSGEAHHGEPESPIAMRPVSLDPPNGLDSNPEESEPTADGKSVPTSDLSDFRELAQLVEPFTSRIVKQATGKKYAEIRHMARDVYAMLTETDMEQPQTIQTLRKFLILCCAGGKTVSETAADCMHKLIEEQYLGGGNGSKALALDEGNPELFESFISAACKGCKVRDEGFSLRIVRTLLAAVQTVAGVHNKSLLQVVQTIYNIYLNSSSANVKQSSRQALERISAKVFEALEENQYDVAAEKRSEAAENGEPDKERSGEDETLYFKDAYQLFKGLCNLSSKQLPSSSSSESMAVKWKLLALDLLKNVLENSGQNFRTHPKFIHAMRSYLAPSILSNALSGSISVVTSAMEILEMVVVQKSFRAILKREIADIFQSVIFRFLESPTAGYGRRRVVLEVLSTICSDPQTLTDMFLNYDCDMNSIHVFEQMITALCSAAQDGVSGPIATPEEGISGGEAGQLRSEALKALVLSLKSLRAWCSSLEVSDDHEIDPVEPQELSGVGSAVEGSASVATLELDETARFQETLRRKKILEEGVQRFNAKPKAGIDYLSSHGYLNATAEEIAGLLKNVRDLDATVVGEYLGEADEISLEVMKTYTKSFDFGGMPFEDALREFLSGFRLPGEAQKIDRIMEAFAGQFHEGNPTIFASKDTPFVLAYSTIMLNTDAHNPQVKKKMSKSEFLRNNRGIDDGNDLDAEILETIYDRIVQDEIKLSGDKKDRASESATGNALGVDRLSRQNWQNMDPRQRNEIFKKESERVLAQAKAQFQKRKAEDIDEIPFYQTASSVHIVRLMLENIWCPILAAMAILLERAGPIDVKTVDLCLDGFRNAIAVVGVFGMDMEKDAFVSSLSKFTLLNSITDMKKKNIECIRVLLAIAASEGSNLGSQWTWMIRAIVQLEQMRAVAANLPNKHRIRNKLPADREESVGNQKITRDGDEISGLSVDANTVLVANSIKDSEVERIFSNSPSLSFAGFYDLCAALCKVSTEELAEGVPVTYCLQKLVEIVLYNIEERQKKQWYRVWQLFSPFFGSALSHKDKDVSLFALDRLKQLVWKFLEADERHAYDFQFLLLKPFESCFSRTTAHPIQESVLTCLSQVALARAANVKSGWKPFYGVMGMAADSKSEEVMKYAYQICDAIVRKHLGVIEEMFIPAISGVGAFTRTPLSSAVAVAALDHLSIRFVSLLSEGKALPAARPLQIEGKVELIFTETVDAHIQTWFPLLIGVSSGITSSLASVRVTATSALFRVLSENGHKFSPGLWTLIYRGVLAPIFDDVKHHLGMCDKAPHIVLQGIYRKKTDPRACFPFPLGARQRGQRRALVVVPQVGRCPPAPLH